VARAAQRNGASADLSFHPRLIERSTIVQRHIELVIGRLLTDEGFRRAFVRDPQQALAAAEGGGLVLNPFEVAALLATDRLMWERMAGELRQTLSPRS
jgi:hypothetical protein